MIIYDCLDSGDDDMGSNLDPYTDDLPENDGSEVKTEPSVAVKQEPVDQTSTSNTSNNSTAMVVATAQNISQAGFQNDAQVGFQNDANGQVVAAEVVDEEMAVDDPELFGPFSVSQLTPAIQTDSDQMFFDSFGDSMTLLKTAIGLVFLL